MNEVTFQILLERQEVMSVSDGVEGLLGFAPADFLSGAVSIASRVHPNDGDMIALLFSAENKLNAEIFNLRVRHADGRIRCLIGSAGRERRCDGRVVILKLWDAAGSRRDASDFCAASYLEMAMESVDECVALKDRHHVYVKANRTFRHAIGAGAEELPNVFGLTDYDLFSEQLADRLYENDRKILAGIPLLSEVRQTERPDGESRWSSERSFLVKDQDGGVFGVFNISADITGTVLRQRALEASEEALKEAQSIARLGSFELDLRAQTWTATDVLYEVLGLERDCDHTLNQWIRLLHGDDLAGMSAAFAAAAVDANRMFDRECRFIREADHMVRWAHVRGRLELDARDTPLRFRGTIQDITDRKIFEAALQESSGLLQIFIHDAPTGLAMFDREMRYLVASLRWIEENGLNEWEIQGRSHYELIPDVPAHWREEHRRALAGETVHSPEDSIHGPDGLIHWKRRTMRPWFTGGGAIGGIMIFSEDITGRKNAEERLHLAASVFTHASEGITITDADGTILEVNDAFMRITGYTRAEVVGKNPRILQSGRQSREFYADMWSQLLAKGHWSGEIWNRAKDGHVYAEMLTISAVRDATGKTQQYVAMFSDISSIKEQERQLAHLAHHDVLTGLPNRVLLADRLRLAMAQAHRRSKPVAVACLDLDNFRTLNDQYGHIVGDQLLTALAHRMRAALHEDDTLARLGGDEFVAVLPELNDVADSIPIVNALQQAVSEPVQVGDLSLKLSASIGMTYFPQTEDVDADQLLRQADQSMYQAKLEGKNRCHVFDPTGDRNVRGHHEDIERIRNALKAEEFVLYFQPKVNMRSGQLLGAEGLIRWQHPVSGLLPPAQFLPIVEGHELTIEIGEWVIDTTLEHMEQWLAEGLDIPVSVNVAALQLQQPAFVSRVRELLDAHPRVARSRLELEVLESSALEDLALVSQVIRDCRELGVTFAMDDFGTGYSSLSYLKRLPVDTLKIDQAFVHDMLDDPDDLMILEGVLGLARSFHRDAIAEGVETVAHGLMLLRMGCEKGQGYGIARPMPASELVRWAASWRPYPEWVEVKPLEPRDWPLLSAIAEVRARTQAVEGFIGGHRKKEPNLDDRCRLGAWLLAETAAGRSDLPTFTHIDALHRRLHTLSMELIALKAKSREEAARNGLESLHALRDELCDKLEELLQSLGTGNRLSRSDVA